MRNSVILFQYEEIINMAIRVEFFIYDQIAILKKNDLNFHFDFLPLYFEL